jgi:hypothetical protein
MEGFSRAFWVTLKLAVPENEPKAGGKGLSKLVEIEANNQI